MGRDPAPPRFQGIPPFWLVLRFSWNGARANQILPDRCRISEHVRWGGLGRVSGGDGRPLHVLLKQKAAGSSDLGPVGSLALHSLRSFVGQLLQLTTTAIDSPAVVSLSPSPSFLGLPFIVSTQGRVHPQSFLLPAPTRASVVRVASCSASLHHHPNVKISLLFSVVP